MAERSYTVQEIDALRRCVENKYLWGRYSGPDTTTFDSNGIRQSRQFRETDLVRSVEETVRTHMLAGHTSQELLASEGATRLPEFMRPGQESKSS